MKIAIIIFIFRNSLKCNLVISTIMRIGSLAIVNTNILNGGPNANNKQPKNSVNAILNLKKQINMKMINKLKS